MPPGTSREQREANDKSNLNPSLRNKMTPEEMAAAIGPGKLSKSSANYQDTSLRLEDLNDEESNVNTVESTSGQGQDEEEQSIRLTGLVPDVPDEDASSYNKMEATRVANQGLREDTNYRRGSNGINTRSNTDDNTMHNSSSIFDTTVDSMGLDGDENNEKPPSSAGVEGTGSSTKATRRLIGLFAESQADSNNTAITATTEASSYDASGNIKPHEPARVSFKPTIECRLYISLRDYSSEEIGATWITELEKKKAQEEVCQTAKMMRRKVREVKRMQEQEIEVGGNDDTSSSSQIAALGSRSSSNYKRIEDEPWYIDTSTLTSRGIEHMRTKKDVQRRREHKRSIVEAVLYEQYLQRMENAHNSVGLALTSHGISRESMMVARGKASGDERHGESERDSFLKRYASAAMRLSQLDAGALASIGNNEKVEQQQLTYAGTGQGDQEHEFDRSSAVSFEKHPDLVCEELNELVDEDSGSNIKDRNGSEEDKSTSEDSSQVSIISKMEVCVLDAEVAAGNISADAANIKLQSGNNGSPPVPLRTVDAYGNQLRHNPTTQRPTFHFNRRGSGGGVTAKMA